MDDIIVTDNFEKAWEESQISSWKCDMESIVLFFSCFAVNVKDVYKRFFSLTYDDMQPIIYLVGKIQKVMAVCGFLDDLAKQGQDIDKIKVFYLISHAEIAMNTFPHHGKNKADLVKEYFLPVISSLKYSFRLSSKSQKLVSGEKNGSSADSILYKLRNEYAHQGDFTGRVFRQDSGSDKTTYHRFDFDWDLQGKGKMVRACGETNLTYRQFLNIYFSAFKSRLEEYMELRLKTQTERLKVKHSQKPV